jgi:hypothetical protein
MAVVIQILLEYFSVVMLVAAFIAAGLTAGAKRGTHESGFAKQLLKWVLLLSVGVQGIYTFVGHVFLPAYSAEHIGWPDSPFQYEVGIADLTVGVLGLIAFWSNCSFRAAAAIAGIIWYVGDAIGHLRQIIIANNYAPGNAGPWFWTDVLVPIVLVVCTLIVWRRREPGSQ